MTKPFVAVVLLIIALAGCGHQTVSSVATTKSSTLTNGSVRHYFGNMSIDVPTDWTSFDPVSHKGCVNLASGSTIVFDNAGDGVCPALARADTNQFVHMVVASQPTAPVLTTIMGMTITNEPVNGFEAQHLHLANADIDEQSIYIPKLKVDINVSAPKASELAAQVLNTVAAVG